ncbi:sugar phosphate isomerase/epimerase [Paenibacillus albidus]|uniref:sugar phosphate isomerase/epimerase family protein n=1 Tax=Paenibacillus albidus TaxID=2041023 RepID=UPI001BE7CE7A|nr:sugar phosphate isomerase/epimerase family protein [Paenibacillus albidus]MBT2292860.1 sugar phosphate isomerase/epimerase [Paenibacillus albidus]
MTELASYGVSTYAFIDRPLKQAVELLAEAGWKRIEIMCEGGHEELLDWTERELEWLTGKAAAHGISWSLHAPITGCNPAAADEVEAARAEGLLLKTLQLAERLGCGFVVLHAGVLESGDEEAGAKERIVHFLKRMVEQTAGSNVTLALENVPPLPGLLGTEITFLLDVAEQVASDRVGLVFDTGHAHMTGTGRCLLMMQQAMPRVVALHLSDNGGREDEHKALGTGSVPLEALVAWLSACNYGGAWVLEMRRPEDLLPSAGKLQRLRLESAGAFGIEPVKGIR